MAACRLCLWLLDAAVGLCLRYERPLILPEPDPLLDEVELLLGGYLDRLLVVLPVLVEREVDLVELIR